MENQKLEIVAQNLLTYCIMPNCDTHGISLKDLLEYMIRMNYNEIDNNTVSTTEDLKIKKRRGRPKGSKNKGVA